MNAESIIGVRRREPWNKDKLAGQKAPLRLKEIWGADPGGRYGLDPASTSEGGGFPLPEQSTRITPPLDATIRANRPRVDTEIGLDAAAYGTHTLRRTKASLIYRRTKNPRAVQLLLGHSKLESTVRYLGIEVDDALEMALIVSANHHKCPPASNCGFIAPDDDQVHKQARRFPVRAVFPRIRIYIAWVFRARSDLPRSGIEVRCAVD